MFRNFLKKNIKIRQAKIILNKENVDKKFYKRMNIHLYLPHNEAKR